jgi:hypothetical protein
MSNEITAYGIPPSNAAEKVYVYFKVIETHFLKPLQQGSVSESCVAALFLIFAVMDSLGRLLHEGKRAGNHERFKIFLKRLPLVYQERGDRLWTLRNDLVHEAMNYTSFMSATKMGEKDHLKTNGGYLFVHTGLFGRDLNECVARIKCEMSSSPELLNRAAGRLDWHYDNLKAYCWGESTAPPGLWYITEGQSAARGDT